MLSSSLSLQHTAAHCNALQHTATHCNTLQHTATHCNTYDKACYRRRSPCNTLQHTATHCSTLQHTATHCNALQHIATYTIRHPIVIALLFFDEGCCRSLHTRESWLTRIPARCVCIRHINESCLTPVESCLILIESCLTAHRSALCLH